MSSAARTVQELWGSTVVRSTVVGLGVFAALLSTGLLVPAQARAADSSAVTVTAAQQDPDVADAPFPDLSVTVAQTEDLTSQGVRLTYSGGRRSDPPGGTAGSNFLQVMQCWGDLLDASGAPVLDAAGQRQPDRTTCQYGATANVGQTRTSTKSNDLEFVSPLDQPYLHPGTGFADQAEVSIPFRSVTGKTIARVVDGQIVPGVDPNENEFFTRLTTNEVPWAPFDASGRGTTTFEVQTNMQAPGLGCGNPQTLAGGAVVGQPCWLVVLPRGDHDWGEEHVTKSGLLAETWTHRLAVRLSFKPLGVRCALGVAERSLAGSELMTTAVASWQPKLCAGTSGSTFNLLVGNEADQALQSNGTAPAPLALTTRALSEPDVTDALTYAPVGLTGLTVAFAVDHRASPRDGVPDEVKGRDGQPFTQLRLTPRLVAKLLTASYKRALPYGGQAADYLDGNPQTIADDPDFLAVNDHEWADQLMFAPSIADALVPLGRSDAAWAVWRYVLSDPDAVAFLAGHPDPWGMVVNPYSATDATINPTGAPATYPTDSFPKADPYEFNKNDQEPLSVVNLVTWRPFAPDLDTAGYWVLRGDGRGLGDWDVLASPPKWATAPRDPQGSQAVLGLTDTAAAAKYQVFTAALRNPAGEFVVPTTESMAAAAAVMTPDPTQAQVRSLDLTSPVVQRAADAYPLTVPVYAATNAAGGDTASRAAYAAFIRYAAGDGQTVGTEPGQLPAGYAPLPPAWRQAALAAAATIQAGPPAAPAPGATTSDPTSAGSGTTYDDAGAPLDASANATAPVPSAPDATGDAAGALTGAPTSDDPSAGSLASTVPVSAVGGLLAAGCVPLVARRRRVL